MKNNKVIRLEEHQIDDYSERLHELKFIQKYAGVYSKALEIIDKHLDDVEEGDNLQVKSHLHCAGKDLRIIYDKLKKREKILGKKLKRLEQSVYTHLSIDGGNK